MYAYFFLFILALNFEYSFSFPLTINVILSVIKNPSAVGKHIAEVKCTLSSGNVVNVEESAEESKPQKYMVTYDKENKDWVIKKTGATRASKRCRTKKEALEIVDQLASNQDLNVSVKKKDGKFQKQKYDSPAEKSKGKRGRPRKDA